MRPYPQATYRLQLSPEQLSFDQAAGTTDYLVRLGISHVYASPYFQAASGSSHGYDVVDPGSVNPELGGPSAHERLCRSLAEAGLGQVLDIVPNHMAASASDNAWWADVLQLGRSSRFAPVFDLDWQPPEPRLAGKILLPFLGDHYGRVLEDGYLQLEAGPDGLILRYHEHVFPLSPASQAGLLRLAAEEAGSVGLVEAADRLAAVSEPPAVGQEEDEERSISRRSIQADIHGLLQSDGAALSALRSLAARLNRDTDRLDRLIQAQHYRLAFWRVVTRDLGYRRFFGINSLVGLRMEEERTFQLTHTLVLDLLHRGVLQGVRVDHPDGLRDPEGYLVRLRQEAPEAWIVVEKILHPGEELPAAWPVAGTTGYDFMHALGQALVDGSGQDSMTELYADFCGEHRPYAQVAWEKKHEVMQGMLGGDLSRLTERFIRVCEGRRRYRDSTRHELRQVLAEFIACLPVYRSYVRPESGRVERQDEQVIRQAAQDAAGRRPDLDGRLFDFLKRLLLLELSGQAESDLVLTLQQVSGPVAAKGLEDTAFYCYNRLAALNEVGGDPGSFGRPLSDFHQLMQRFAEQCPRTMLSTSTHDSKRSEDVRARLFLLSEIPDAWGEAVRRWSARNEPYRTNGWPDTNMEYLFYQTLVGAWPIEGARAEAYMEKAAREAGTHTAWTSQNQAYEQALRDFVRGVLNDQDFLDDLRGFVQPLIVPGRTNSLTQTLIKLSAPGVPDIYQGTELWDLSLVDPDNRRPVDFGLRRRLLEELDRLSPEAIMQRQDEGLPKLWLIKQVLGLRRHRPELFDGAGYRPLAADGGLAEHVLAFCRGESLVAIAPRLVMGLRRGWDGTSLNLPAGCWRNILDGRRTNGGQLKLAGLLDVFPVALLVRCHDE
jgi:(1->4)-alpha-D-glucan 1-alpha-D-glucosylmutase